MERRHLIAGAPELKVAVRVRGLSHDQRYFDELTSTTRVTKDFIVIRARERVDLDSELHVTNMRTQVGGTYRVAWINTRPQDDRYAVGLELLDPEGEIWEADSIPSDDDLVDARPVAPLECSRCYQRAAIPLSEVEAEALNEGLLIARHCDTCKATTNWAFYLEKAPAVEAGPEEMQNAAPEGAQAAAPEPAPAASGMDLRKKGRAPIRLTIKVIRSKYGLNVFDVCETINVSRTGVYFITEQGYEIGENLEIVLPYHPDSMAIPVSAVVVRQDSRPGVYQKQVAIRFNPGGTP